MEKQTKAIRDQGAKRGRGTKKQPVFGVLCRNGQVWAEIVDDVDADTLQPFYLKKSINGIHRLS